MNKELYHSFVESPEMLNLYRGSETINLDKKGYGEISISLPSYFEALNKDHKFSLTPINSFCQLAIKQKVKDNKFVVMAQGSPNTKCSFDWLTSGVRQDRFANANRIIPEVRKAKPGYIHPDLW